jgi:hypothetical protein
MCLQHDVFRASVMCLLISCDQFQTTGYVCNNICTVVFSGGLLLQFVMTVIAAINSCNA